MAHDTKWLLTFRCSQTGEAQTVIMCDAHSRLYRVDGRPSGDELEADDDVDCESCAVEQRSKVA